MICRNAAPGQGAAAGWQMMLPAESGTLPHRPWATMPLVNGRTRKRSAAGGWSEAEVCAEEVADPRKPMWHHWKRLPIRGSRCVCSVEDLAALLGYSAGCCRCEVLEQTHKKRMTIAVTPYRKNQLNISHLAKRLPWQPAWPGWAGKLAGPE